MSVPPDKLMELMSRAKTGSMSSEEPFEEQMETETPPMSAPMSTPEPKLGSKEGAMVNVSIALDLLEQSLPALGADSEEGKKAMDVIRSLNAMLGPRKNQTNELQQSEILQMLQTLPQAGGMSPESRAIARQPLPGLPPTGGMPQPA